MSGEKENLPSTGMEIHAYIDDTTETGNSGSIS